MPYKTRPRSVEPQGKGRGENTRGENTRGENTRGENTRGERVARQGPSVALPLAPRPMPCRRASRRCRTPAPRPPAAAAARRRRRRRRRPSCRACHPCPCRRRRRRRPAARTPRGAASRRRAGAAAAGENTRVRSAAVVSKPYVRDPQSQQQQQGLGPADSGTARKGRETEGKAVITAFKREDSCMHAAARAHLLGGLGRPQPSEEVGQCRHLVGSARTAGGRSSKERRCLR
eukprot:SAG22_NODE_155_length_17123_cov_37.528489_29_plen_232_part_00